MKLKELFLSRRYPLEEVGIEIEMEGDYLPPNVPGWVSKGDGSLRGNALEYVFDGPTNREEARERVKNLYKRFYSSDYSVNPSDRCGVHVHLNVNDIEVEKVFNNITLFLMLEDVLMRWCGDNREGNLFCLRARDAEYIIYELVQAKKTLDFKKINHSESVKYANLNLAAMQRYGSLEYRGLETPEKVDNILIWLDTLLKIKDYSMKIKDIKNTVNKVCKIGPKKFLYSVIGEELGNNFVYKNLEDDMLESVRRVQILAYTEMGKLKKKEKQHNIADIAASIMVTARGGGGGTIIAGSGGGGRGTPIPPMTNQRLGVLQGQIRQYERWVQEDRAAIEDYTNRLRDDDLDASEREDLETSLEERQNLLNQDTEALTMLRAERDELLTNSIVQEVQSPFRLTARNEQE